MTLDTNLKVSPLILRGFIAEVFKAHGIPDGDADIVAEMMVEADLLGGDAHGVFRLPRYVERLRAGGYNLTPDIHVEKQIGGLARVNGDDAIGHLVVRKCVDEAMSLAEVHGVSWVGCHHSNHAGAAGIWALRPVARDMIGIYMAVGSANHMAPWGGIDQLLSTNPIAIGVPGGDNGPILLDMATTNAASGKVKLAAQRGEDIPDNWMIDTAGNPITDPTKASGGSLLPLGGAKGYGLALMVGLLAGTLNGAAMGTQVVDFSRDQATSTNTGQSILVINLKAFDEVSLFKREVDRIRQELITSRLRPGFDEIRLPGDRALKSREDRMANGIPCPAPLLAALRPVATEAGVQPLEQRV